jgi:hypothetical protein
VGWSGRRRRQRGEEDGDEEPRDGHGRGYAGWGFLRAPRKGNLHREGWREGCGFWVPE